MASLVMHCSLSPVVMHNRASSCPPPPPPPFSPFPFPSLPVSFPSSGIPVYRKGHAFSAQMQHQQQQPSEYNDERLQAERYSLSTATRDCKLYSSSASSLCNRRNIFYMVGAAAAVVMGGRMVGSEEAIAAAAEYPVPPKGSEPAATTKPSANETKVDTTITDKVYLDLSICPNASRSDRTLGNTSQLCNVGEPLGRIVIGLYGRLVPQTVKNFKAMINGKAGTSYAGTIFHRVLAGQYIQGGRQGSKDKGEVSGLLKLASNQETVSSKAYKLTHTRPGTVSLALAENDDDEELKLDVDYRNVQFLITTGPGPAPQLDNGNIVFGTVMEGLDVVAAVAKVPTYRPNERIKQFNDFALFLGDERAANARTFWDRPLKSVVISGCAGHGFVHEIHVLTGWSFLHGQNDQIYLKLREMICFYRKPI